MEKEPQFIPSSKEVKNEGSKKEEVITKLATIKNTILAELEEYDKPGYHRQGPPWKVIKILENLDQPEDKKIILEEIGAKLRAVCEDLKKRGLSYASEKLAESAEYDSAQMNPETLELDIDLFLNDFLPTITGKKVYHGNQEFTIVGGPNVFRSKDSLVVPVRIHRGKAIAVPYEGNDTTRIVIKKIGLSSRGQHPELQKILDEFPSFLKSQRHELLGDNIQNEDN